MAAKLSCGCVYEGASGAYISRCAAHLTTHAGAKPEDVELARTFADSLGLDRGQLGTYLFKGGMGIGHHAHNSGCADRIEYINLVLDEIMPE